VTCFFFFFSPRPSFLNPSQENVSFFLREFFPGHQLSLERSIPLKALATPPPFSIIRCALKIFFSDLSCVGPFPHYSLPLSLCPVDSSCSFFLRVLRNLFSYCSKARRLPFSRCGRLFFFFANALCPPFLIISGFFFFFLGGRNFSLSLLWCFPPRHFPFSRGLLSFFFRCVELQSVPF